MQERHAPPCSALTIGDLCELYLNYARTYYRRRATREPTGEHENIASVLKRWRTFAGEQNDASRVTRHQLRAWLDQLAADDLTRAYCNACLSRVRRMIRWAADLDYLPTSVLAEVQLVRPLPAHRSAAREPAPREPAVLEHVRSSLAFMPRHARDVVHLLMLTGARVSEIIEATTRDVVDDEQGRRLVPRQHKTAHHNRHRIIPLNAAAWTIIEPRLKPFCPNDPLFPAPRGSRKQCYSTDALRAAITRACARAGVARYTPHQIRHAVARIVRQQRGLDASCSLLGHSSVTQTEDYAPTPALAAIEASEVLT